MARIRKSSRIWRDDQAVAEARGAMVTGDETCFALDLARCFERRAPIEIELGAGRGSFILSRAAACPDRNFLAIEISRSVAMLLAVKVARSGLDNLKVLRADARTIVNLMLPAHSVSAFHIYFPDPWPKDRHAKHRLFSPFFVASLARTLSADGTLHVATDVHEYAARIVELIEAAGFLRRDDTVEGALGSNFGRKYAAAGRVLHAASFAPPPADGRNAHPDGVAPSPHIR